jgi:hypothetical protein
MQIKKHLERRSSTLEPNAAIKVVSSLPVWKQQVSADNGEVPATPEASTSFNILGTF